MLPTVQLIIALNCTARLSIIKTVRQTHLLFHLAVSTRENEKRTIRKTLKINTFVHLHEFSAHEI